MSCLIGRTKSPPVSVLLGDDLGEALARDPGVGDGEERRVRRPVHGEAVLLLGERELGRQPLDLLRSARGRRWSGTTAAAGRRATGARRRTTTPARPASARRGRRARRAATVSATSRSLSWNTRASISPPSVSCHRSTSTRPRSARIASTPSNSRASDGVAVQHPRLDLGDLAPDAVGLAGGPQPLLEIGVVLDRVQPGAGRRAGGAAARVAVARRELGLLDPPADLDAVVGPVRRVHARQHDRADLHRRHLEVGTRRAAACARWA